MKNNFVTKNEDNFSVINKGVNLNLTLVKSCTENVSLKDLLKKSLHGAAFFDDLKIQLVLADGIHVNLIDDLLDFDITKSKLEIILNKKSSLNYELKIVDELNFDQTDDGLLMGFGKQGCVDKELSFKFIGEYSQAKVRCSCKGTHDRLFKFKTIQDHQAANTKSDLVLKGAFCQQSKLICDSLIKVDEFAQKVEATQLNKNLLLGCKSRAISIPKLEILADDVKCKHGAAVSKLDDEQVFYLQSRGIDYCKARNLLIDAFLN